MANDAIDVREASTPTVGLALALFGVSVLAMLGVFGAFYLYQRRASDLNAPLFSAAMSLVAVLLPALAACAWPRLRGLPPWVPSYQRPPRAVVVGTFFISLPLYALSAAVLLGGAWDPVRAAPGAATSAPASPSLAALAGIWLAFALLPAVAEELMYRGVIQPAIAQRWGAAWGIGVTAVMFSFIHMEPAGLAPRVLMGAWFGFLAWRTGSLWASTWAHALNNTWGVALLAVGAWLSPHPVVVLLASLASLATGLWCFESAGWLGGASEPPSAPVAVQRLKETGEGD